MRITCPRCHAGYTIPDAAIPAEGRDVQCSACGHSWYLLRPAGTAEAEDTATRREQTPTAAAEEGPETRDRTDPPEVIAERRAARLREALDGQRRNGAASPSDLPERAAASVDAAVSVADPGGDDEADSPPSADVGGVATPWAAQREPAVAAGEGADAAEEAELPRPSRKLDPGMLEMLREEAEREARARRGRAAPLETQTDLGLDPPAPRRGVAGVGVRDRLARLKAAERAQVDPVWRSGEESFPDPAQLGATLKEDRPLLIAPATPPDEEDATPAAPPAPPNLPVVMRSRELAVIEQQQARRGFRVGFAIPVALSCGALALYAAAPWLGAHAPETAPVMDAVAEHGDALRDAIAAHLRAMLETVTGSPRTGS